MVEKSYIGLGSNLGNRMQNLSKAVELVDKDGSTSVSNISKIYVSEPKYNSEQPDFLNAVIEIETSRSPSELLNLLLKIEGTIGRIRDKKNGPRLIDLDILFYGNEIIKSENLEIPHPLLYERLFVLKPLMDINSMYVCPVTGKTVSELLSITDDKQSTEIFDENIIKMENTHA